MKPHSVKIMVDEHGMNYFAWAIMCDCFFTKPYIKQFTGKPFISEVMIIQGEHGQWAPSISNVKGLAESVMEKIKAETFDIAQIEKLHLHFGRKVIAQSKILPGLFGQIPASDFARRLTRLWDDYGNLCCLGFVIVWSDIEYGLLTKELEKILKAKNVKQQNLQRDLSLLISPVRKIAPWTEKKELLNIAVKFNSYAGAAESPEFKRHSEKYKWLQYGYQGPELTPEYFKNELRKIFKRGPKKQLASHLAYFAELRKKQAELKKKLKLSPKEIRLFEMAKNIMFLKAYRIDVRHIFHWHTDKMFKKLGLKCHLPLTWFHYSDRADILNLIRTGKADAQKGLARSKFILRVSEGGKVKFIPKNKAEKFLKRHLLQEKIVMSSEISGATAFPGVVKDRVRIVLSKNDLGKISKGDILVASATTPELLPAMHKAAAFVTDAGGITSHAAIVAREMKKPCVIGTRIATKIFKDGDIIQVDADQGIVRKIS